MLYCVCFLCFMLAFFSFLEALKHWSYLFLYHNMYSCIPVLSEDIKSGIKHLCQTYLLILSFLSKPPTQNMLLLFFLHKLNSSQNWFPPCFKTRICFPLLVTIIMCTLQKFILICKCLTNIQFLLWRFYHSTKVISL